MPALKEIVMHMTEVAMDYEGVTMEISMVVITTYRWLPQFRFVTWIMTLPKQLVYWCIGIDQMTQCSACQMITLVFYDLHYIVQYTQTDSMLLTLFSTRRTRGPIGVTKFTSASSTPKYEPYDAATIALNNPVPGDSWPTPQLRTGVVLGGVVRVDSSTSPKAFLVGAQSLQLVSGQLPLLVTLY